ncbi:MAG: acyl transferase [Bacteroidota bacterium]
MKFAKEFKNKIFNITGSRPVPACSVPKGSGNFRKDRNNSQAFENLAIELFHYQAANNNIYKEYLKFLKINAKKVNTLFQIPFLPIGFFKTHKIITGKGAEEQIFLSSGTTGGSTSKHHILDISLYEKSFRKGFEHFYGNIEDYCILALLPTHSESSSLVYMVKKWIEKSSHKDSGFYLKSEGHNRGLNDIQELTNKLNKLENGKQKVLLFGTSFALLDFIETVHETSLPDLKNTIIMETGGMKGQRKEIVREALHKKLSDAFGVKAIHSEYGMTELLSQAYSKTGGVFKPPPWMKIFIRELNDPLTITRFNKTGGINIIDLANIHSCAFIATDDLGKIYKDGSPEGATPGVYSDIVGGTSFEILGRIDNSDVRGCNVII